MKGESNPLMTGVGDVCKKKERKTPVNKEGWRVVKWSFVESPHLGLVHASFGD